MCYGLSLLEMHSGGNDQWPRCHPTLVGVLGVWWPNTYLLLGQALLGGAYGWQSLFCSTPTPVGGLTQWCTIYEMTGRVYGYSPWAAKLRHSLVWHQPQGGSDLAGQTKNKTSGISLLTCTRCSAAPMTNVAVLKVSQPTANQKWALRCGVHHFYRKF